MRLRLDGSCAERDSAIIETGTDFPPPLVGGGRGRGEPRNRTSVLARSLESRAAVAEVARRPQRALRAKRAMLLCVRCNLCDLRAEKPADRRTRATPAWRHPSPPPPPPGAGGGLGLPVPHSGPGDPAPAPA